MGAVQLRLFLNLQPHGLLRFSPAVNLLLYFTHKIKAATFQLISRGTHNGQCAFYAGSFIFSDWLLHRGCWELGSCHGRLFFENILKVSTGPGEGRS